MVDPNTIRTRKKHHYIAKVLLGIVLVVALVILLALITPANQDSTGLFGVVYQIKFKLFEITRQARLSQSEVSFKFTGRVLYGSGKPVSNTEVTMGVISIHNTDDKEPYDVPGRAIKCMTDSAGYFTVEGKGRTIILHSINSPAKLLYDKDMLTRNLRVGNTLGFSMSNSNTSGHYVPDPDNPAVFILVRPGEVITSWPSRGGKDVYPNGKEYVNAPMRPNEPSVPLVETEDGWVYQPY